MTSPSPETGERVSAEQRAEWREKALAATPGPWTLEYGHPPTERFVLWSRYNYPKVLGADLSPTPADAAYIAFSHPARVLALLAENERLAERVTSALDWLDHGDIAAAEYDLRDALGEPR